MIGLLQNRFGNAYLGVGKKGGKPLAVDVDAVTNGLVLHEGETQSMADDLFLFFNIDPAF